MINTKQGVWLLGVLGLIMVILLCILFFAPAKKVATPENNGIEITSPAINSEISSPLKIAGTVDGNGWGGFEGQVGSVRLLDDKGNQIGVAILTATTDWMNPSIDFETYLQFSSERDQNGSLVFHNENPSDMRDRDRTFTLPVKIKKGSGEMMTVKAFFNNNTMDPEISCNKVFVIERQVPKTIAVARVALEELLKGPTISEKNEDYSTSINSGVKIQSLTIENGTAKVDFDEQLEYQAGGSCRVSAIRAQITETLKQFPTVKNVVISINGRTEDILQP